MITAVELTRKGFKALVDTLGYVDAVMFLRLFDQGIGDYFILMIKDQGGT